MDYEKKYKNLLAKAKEFEFQGYIDEECLYDMFPELKESEGERIRKALIKYYSFDKDGGSHALDNITPKQIVAWLKSLRPQSTWKPSDEQMGVIEAVVNNRSFQRRHLDSLYEQLKKLREE